MITWMRKQPHEDDKNQYRLCFCLYLSACTSGSRAVIKSLCSSPSLFTMWIRHFSLGWEKANTNTKIRSDSTANQSIRSHVTLVLFYLFLSTWQSHPLSWGRGVFQSLKQDDFERFQIRHNKWPALISLSSAQLLQHAVRLLLHAWLLGLKTTDIKWTENTPGLKSFEFKTGQCR